MERHKILDVFERITTRASFIRPVALELFCGAGHGQATAYAPMCEYLEGWDIVDERIAEFKKNIPRARGKVCDAYKELSQPRGADEVKLFNVVLVDNSFLKARGGFEHFDVFPAIYNVMNPSGCFVVFTVCPDPYSYAEPRKDALQKAFGSKVDEFMKDWDAARDRFYKLPTMDPANMPKHRPVSSVRLQDMEEIYKDRFESDGWAVPYTFSIMRGKAAGYVLVEAKREPVEITFKGDILPGRTMYQGKGEKEDHKPLKKSRKKAANG